MSGNSYTCLILAGIVAFQILCVISRLGVAAQNRICREYEQFTCENKECVSPVNARCDGVVQCQDGSDEVDCSESGCILPEQPIGGSYELNSCTGNSCKLVPGTRVPSNTFLTFKCNERYTLDGNPVVYCLTNAWYMPPKCIKTCPFLSSQTVDLVCKYRDEEIQWNSTMFPGTRATLQCKYLYKVPSRDPGYREIVCLETGEWDNSVYTCEPECGRKVIQQNPSMINGVQADNNQPGFPWLINIYKRNSYGSYERVCRGSLVEPSRVISAAHCFYDESANKIVDKSQFMVFAGQDFGLDNFEGRWVQSSTVRMINIPPTYSGSKGNYTQDIADIHLDVDCTMTQFVRTICFDYNQRLSIEEMQSDKYGKAVGWGKTEPEAASTELQEISLPIIPREQCISALSGGYKNFVTYDKYCAGYLNGSSVCDNDSGSGLYIQSDGLWYLRGIVSVSPVLTGTCVNNYYTVFMDPGYTRWPSSSSMIPVPTLRPTTTQNSLMTGCILPRHPKGGKFEVALCKGPCPNRAGNRVSLGSVLIYKCNEGFKINGNNVTVCYDNRFYPRLPPPTCSRTQKISYTEQDTSCRENENFMCESGQCIPQADAQCDGFIQCQDGSDEIGCPGSGCTLPDQPIGGSFILKGCTGNSCSVLQEEKVSSGNFLTYHCNEGYVLKGNIISPCLINAWFMPPACVKTCPVLTSKSVDIVCKYRDEIVSCNSPMIPGTKATLACKDLYTFPLGSDPVYREITCLEEGVWDLAVFKCIPECGEPVRRVTPLILHGTSTNVGDFPWHVGVYQRSSSKYYDQICGGTLISPDLVVSAAHCFYDDTLNEVMDASQFGVAAGKYFRTYNFSEPSAQYSKVNRIDVAEKYHGFDGNFAQDIALVRLKIALVIKTFVKPICLDWDKKHENDDLRSGISGEVAGWGKTATGKPSTILQKTSLPYIPLDNCLSKVPSDFRSLVTSDKFCAGNLNGSNVCQGDSGGGLVFEFRGLWFLRGIVSVSPMSDSTKCNVHYTAFTNVGNFLDWIRKAILSAA